MFVHEFILFKAQRKHLLFQAACQSWAAASVCSEVTSISKAWEEVRCEQAKCKERTQKDHNKLFHGDLVCVFVLVDSRVLVCSGVEQWCAEELISL